MSETPVKPKTYTIAYHDLLIACVPDGEDIDKAVLEHIHETGEDLYHYFVDEGLILTDEYPYDNPDSMRWSGFALGQLWDENGKRYDYAIKP